ncbi:Zinc/iron permease [Boletus reticuloceps]|uniref:Zinc/iron permease n=1 Tax=Boletus reticuloceps TaxID=495285 RepID=A0A8I2YUW1_9AGAM|nr:Zinc/iron permease [Boletus reticuloceps]
MFPSGLQHVVGMSLVLGAASYGIGLAPLSVPLSKKQLSVLSNLGTGLLIGTAIGVILPEGIEELVTGERSSYSFNIGLPILLGFAAMFVLEEYASHGLPHAHSSTSQPGGLVFDVDLEERGRLPAPEHPPLRHAETSGVQRAYPLSLGLIIHALIDGYALGVSASNTRSPNLSIVVFFAIIVHKAPTALALTTALLANSLPVTECKRYLLYFSLATPVSSILTYGLYAFHSEKNTGTWAGSALLFSGGTFLYVASVMQPVSGHASESPASEIGKTVRIVLLVGGMFFPLLASQIVVHEH